MKHLILILVTSGIILGIMSCESEPYETDRKVLEAVIEVPDSTATDIPVSFNSNQLGSNIGVNKFIMFSIKPEEITVSVNKPHHGNFQPFEFMDVYFGTPIKAKKIIGWKKNINGNNTDSLELTLAGENIRNYFFDGSFHFNMETRLNQPLDTTYKLHIHCTLLLKSNVSEREQDIIF